jgi:hypothetical protein
MLGSPEDHFCVLGCSTRDRLSCPAIVSHLQQAVGHSNRLPSVLQKLGSAPVTAVNMPCFSEEQSIGNKYL